MVDDRSEREEKKRVALSQRIKNARLVITGFRNQRAQAVPAGKRGRGGARKRK